VPTPEPIVDHAAALPLPGTPTAEQAPAAVAELPAEPITTALPASQPAARPDIEPAPPLLLPQQLAEEFQLPASIGPIDEHAARQADSPVQTQEPPMPAAAPPTEPLPGPEPIFAAEPLLKRRQSSLSFRFRPGRLPSRLRLPSLRAKTVRWQPGKSQ